MITFRYLPWNCMERESIFAKIVPRRSSFDNQVYVQSIQVTQIFKPISWQFIDLCKHEKILEHEHSKKESFQMPYEVKNY